MSAVKEVTKPVNAESTAAAPAVVDLENLVLPRRAMGASHYAVSLIKKLLNGTVNCLPNDLTITSEGKDSKSLSFKINIEGADRAIVCREKDGVQSVILKLKGIEHPIDNCLREPLQLALFLSCENAMIRNLNFQGYHKLFEMPFIQLASRDTVYYGAHQEEIIEGKKLAEKNVYKINFAGNERIITLLKFKPSDRFQGRVDCACEAIIEIGDTRYTLPESQSEELKTSLSHRSVTKKPDEPGNKPEPEKKTVQFNPTIDLHDLKQEASKHLSRPSLIKKKEVAGSSITFKFDFKDVEFKCTVTPTWWATHRGGKFWKQPFYKFKVSGGEVEFSDVVYHGSLANQLERLFKGLY
jgi:hypothetical protein